jgi:hypothetical protein
VNFITYLEPPYLLDYNYIVVPLPTGFFVSAYLNGEGVQEFFTYGFKNLVCKLNLSISLWMINIRTGMFHNKMVNEVLDYIINKMGTLIGQMVNGHPNLVRICSYRNLVVTTTMLVQNAWASTHFVA